MAARGRPGAGHRGPSEQIKNRFTARMIFHTPCLDMVEEVILNFKKSFFLSLKLDLIFNL